MKALFTHFYPKNTGMHILRKLEIILINSLKDPQNHKDDKSIHH